jgi:hypothetical protein
MAYIILSSASRMALIGLVAGLALGGCSTIGYVGLGLAGADAVDSVTAPAMDCPHWWNGPRAAGCVPRPVCPTPDAPRWQCSPPGGETPKMPSSAE